MGSIIYKSDNIIPWDTQSAFKMISYNVSAEENMIFCYLKSYVHHGDLVLCSYCFTEKPAEYANMHLYINLAPEHCDKTLKISYGFSNIYSAGVQGTDVKNDIIYTSFKADDEQGFYWCGEIRLPAAFAEKHYGYVPQEKSIITMNMMQTFENGDRAVLFGDAAAENYNRAENMEAFVVLNY